MTSRIAPRPLAIAPQQLDEAPMIITRRRVTPASSSSSKIAPAAAPQKPTLEAGKKRKRSSVSVSSSSAQQAHVASPPAIHPPDLINYTASPAYAAPMLSPSASSISSKATSSIESDIAVIQPSRKYVLPERNKPGRKPAADEPMTKRTAQNRASQRAFRERKQAHVASLEAKIAQYEQERLDGNIRLQRIAQRMKEENDRLKGALKERDREIESWKGRAMRLLGWASEQTGLEPPVEVWKGNSDSAKARQIGCQAPAHEKAASTSRKPSASTKESAVLRKSPQISITFSTSDPSQQSSTQKPSNTPPIASIAPPALLRTSPNACGFCTEGDGMCICAAIDEATAEHQVSLVGSAEAVSTSVKGGCSKNGGVCACASGKKEPAHDKTSKSKHTDEGGDCGFCAGEGRCACRGDGIIDFDTAVAQPPPSQGSAQKPPSTAVTSVPISLGLRKSASGSRKKYSKPPLWALHPPSDSALSTQPVTSVPLRGGNRMPGIRQKLWQTYSGAVGSSSTSSSAAACSGDPSNCAACSTDPALAKFCEAVSERETAEKDPPGATVPEAFRQLKNHPNFEQFEGGLDLLADVVAGRSPALAGAKVGVPGRPDLQQTSHRQSGLEALASIRGGPSTVRLPTLPSAPDSAIGNKDRHLVALDHLTGDDDTDTRTPKRRRLYVNNEAIQNALTLLDRGAFAFGKDSRPCPCPWVED